MNGVVDGARLGVCLRNQMGKTVTVDFGVTTRIETAGEDVGGGVETWTRKVTTSEDLEECFEQFDRLCYLLMDRNVFIYYEGFEIDIVGEEEVKITLNWTS